DPGPVRVGEDEVVELGKEPCRRGDVLVRARGVREVEQLAAALVAEGAQLAAEPFEGVARGGQRQRAPRLEVLRGGGAEGGQVLARERERRVVLRMRALQPLAGEREIGGG